MAHKIYMKLNWFNTDPFSYKPYAPSLGPDPDVQPVYVEFELGDADVIMAPYKEVNNPFLRDGETSGSEVGPQLELVDPLEEIPQNAVVITQRGLVRLMSALAREMREGLS